MPCREHCSSTSGDVFVRTHSSMYEFHEVVRLLMAHPTNWTAELFWLEMRFPVGGSEIAHATHQKGGEERGRSANRHLSPEPEHAGKCRLSYAVKQYWRHACIGADNTEGVSHHSTCQMTTTRKLLHTLPATENERHREAPQQPKRDTQITHIPTTDQHGCLEHGTPWRWVSLVRIRGRKGSLTR